MSQQPPVRLPRYAGLCPQCSIGNPGACDCIFLMPAEASSSLGFEDEPAPRRRRGLLLKLRIWHSRWLLKTLRDRMDRLELKINEATELVIVMARASRHSPWLQGHRRAMRDEHGLLFTRWATVRKELDALEKSL
ncbi:MAG: hypothetical protein EOP39_23605 [Rubrivivax sp.]|nr:MAG: hypothetical protein EOP39_23605 [Rubrivivax sp.]